MIISVIPSSVLRHGGFHSHVATPRAGCFIIEIPLKIGWVYLEYSYFRKPPYGRFWCMLRYLLATNLKQPQAMFASPSLLAICLPLPAIPRALTFTTFTIITICYTLLQNWHSKKKSKQYIMNISMIVNSLTTTRHLTGNHNQNQIEVADHALHQCAQPWHAGRDGVKYGDIHERNWSFQGKVIDTWWENVGFSSLLDFLLTKG